MDPDLIFDTVGTLGVALILLGYFLVQTQRVTSQQLVYPALNLAGATLLLVSLTHSWNTPSVIIELCWIAISLYGITSILKRKRRGDGDADPE